jgi:hypothetical protein
MRTKTKVLSALLGVLGTASMMAQSTNVYSLNAVGYVNVTCLPGFNIIADPLWATVGQPNTIGTVLNNTNGAYDLVGIFELNGANPYITDIGHHKDSTNGWLNGGVIPINPGQAVWFQNPDPTNIVITFVGTVPQGSLTNTLAPGYNLVSSAVPTSGDLVTNPITSLTNYNPLDAVNVYDPNVQGFSGAGGIYIAHKAGKGQGGYENAWLANGDPVVPNVGEGFFYQNNQATNLLWVENFTISQ